MIFVYHHGGPLDGQLKLIETEEPPAQIEVPAAPYTDWGVYLPYTVEEGIHVFKWTEPRPT